MNKKELIVDYTVSDLHTYNLVYCFTDMRFFEAEETIDVYLQSLYPMFRVQIQNLCTQQELDIINEQGNPINEESDAFDEAIDYNFDNIDGFFFHEDCGDR